MSTLIGADRLRDIESGTQQAWSAYSDTTRHLSGPEYDQAERDAWEELQRELRRLERRRKLLSTNTT